MDRKQYNQCMVPYMKGSKTKEQRQFDMCVGAKICSGKAKNEDEAISICSLPKEPKPVKIGRAKKGQSCEKEAGKLAQCMMNYFEDNNLYKQILNVNSVEIAIRNALVECSCQK
jgi:hypothetical protein